jgi:hypothetical protein
VVKVLSFLAWLSSPSPPPRDPSTCIFVHCSQPYPPILFHSWKLDLDCDLDLPISTSIHHFCMYGESDRKLFICTGNCAVSTALDQG